MTCSGVNLRVHLLSQIQIAVKDIGNTCAAQALGVGRPLPENPFTFELHGPQSYSTNDVREALTEVLGKDVRADIVPKESLPDFFSSFLPPNVAQLFVEMTRSFLPGGVIDASHPASGRVERGKVSLVEGFRDMLAA
jgi:uncharacterized protein YbjT (DUF2867 family)